MMVAMDSRLAYPEAACGTSPAAPLPPLPGPGACDTATALKSLAAHHLAMHPPNVRAKERPHAGHGTEDRLDRHGPHGLSDGRAAVEGRLRRFDLEPHPYQSGAARQA